MPGQQFNVPLEEHHAVALRQLALRDDKTVPEVLRPVIEAFLDQELGDDVDLKAAVEALLRSRHRKSPAAVTRLGEARRGKSRSVTE